MQIVRNRETKVAYYKFNNGEWVTLTDILVTKNFKALDINITTHEIVEGDAPLLFVGGAMTYNNGVWTVINEETYNSVFENEKVKYAEKIKASYIAKTTEPSVDTGLGFSVDGGYDKIKDFEVGKKYAFPSVKASDNEFYPVTLADYDTIISAIEMYGIEMLQWKWAKQEEVDACTTIEELESVEE